LVKNIKRNVSNVVSCFYSVWSNLKDLRILFAYFLDFQDIPQENSSVSQKLSQELYEAQLQALSMLHAETQSRYCCKLLFGIRL